MNCLKCNEPIREPIDILKYCPHCNFHWRTDSDGNLWYKYSRIPTMKNQWKQSPTGTLAIFSEASQ